MTKSEFQGIYVIADQIRGDLDQHVALLARTEDPTYRKLIRLCLDWWIMWNVGGLCNEAVPGGCTLDELFGALADKLSELEQEIITLVGPAGFDAFVTWAKERLPGYEEPPWLR